jgi:molecular chaperone HtpG
MSTETQPQTKEFQAETKQVLRLVIHSLYSHKEIFLRELISNASDACEKLRFEALAKPELLGADALSVTLAPDAAAGTLSIKDNGIGMSEAEVIDNLGTIARSGTKKFLEALSGDSAKDAQLIGQFGVGFYSAFIVADKVTVLTKCSDAAAVRWDSDGEGQYQIQAGDKTDRGTEVILHLRDEDKEFLEPARLRSERSRTAARSARRPPGPSIRRGECRARNYSNSQRRWRRAPEIRTPSRSQSWQTASLR